MLQVICAITAKQFGILLILFLVSLPVSAILMSESPCPEDDNVQD